MAQLMVMYKMPKDAAAFDKHYFEAHIPIAKKIPGLRKYEISKGPIVTPLGASGFHLIALRRYGGGVAGICERGGVGRGGRRVDVYDGPAEHADF